jgi:phosphoribulokinase
MSALHPIIAVTGSSGAGTTTSSRSFDWIFRHEQIAAAHVDGDAFHSHTRQEMTRLIAEAERAGQRGPTHMGPEANLFERLEQLFAEYGAEGSGQTRQYVHDEVGAARIGQAPGTFTEWAALPENTDLLFYEGLHGGVVTDVVDVARHVDLLIGVVPTINLEWVQKILRDTRERGYTLENVQENILRRMHDYVHYIVPQFSRTHINFQRVPIVDTSNPFIAREVPSSDETLVVVRFRDPRSVDFPYLLSMLHGSWMTRANTIVVPGGELELAMQVILTPLIRRLVDRRNELLSP